MKPAMHQDYRPLVTIIVHPNLALFPSVDDISTGMNFVICCENPVQWVQSPYDKSVTMACKGFPTFHFTFAKRRADEA